MQSQVSTVLGYHEKNTNSFSENTWLIRWKIKYQKLIRDKKKVWWFKKVDEWHGNKANLCNEIHVSVARSWEEDITSSTFTFYEQIKTTPSIVGTKKYVLFEIFVKETQINIEILLKKCCW